MDRENRKYIYATVGMLFVLLMFAFTAKIEFDRTIAREKQIASNTLNMVKSQLENIITSRMRSIYGMVAYAEISDTLSQGEYNSFAKGIYESDSEVVQSITFITDTTITHIYPYDEYKQAIGIDLAKVDSQKALILYAKNNQKSVFVAPVDLVEGGRGIIVRMPAIVKNRYYGQVAIVFDFDKTLEVSGIVGLGDTFFISLTTIDALTGNENVVWSNYEGHIDEAITSEVDLLDTKAILSAFPKGGWKGQSTLFIMISALGLVTAFATFTIILKLLSTQNELEDKQLELKSSNASLMVINNEMSKTLDELYESREQLQKQNDAIIKQESHIKYLAEYDALTELYNRSKFTEHFDAEIKAGRCGTVILLDLDHFKNINDTLGHIYGDKVLIHVGTLIKTAISGNMKAYRLGGDEFLILIPNVTADSYVTDVIEEINRVVSGANEIDQIQNHITLSLGVTRYPTDGTKVDEILMKSDIAMYSAKKMGRSQFQFFNDKMVEAFGERIAIEQQLRRAIDNGTFLLHYQPIVDARTGKTVYYEALLRLDDNAYRPDQFIPVAEETGLIVPIGNLVVDMVFALLTKLKNLGKEVLPIAINLSPKQINEASVVDHISGLLAESGLSPCLLEVEITENVLMEYQEENIETLERIKSLGISIALDDFGTGYSSLNYLTFIPVNKIKLDKSLKDKFLHRDDTKMIEGLIAIAHGLSLKVVAEGVETVEEVEKLQKHECDYIQGYYFNKPMPEGELISRT